MAIPAVAGQHWHATAVEQTEGKDSTYSCPGIKVSRQMGGKYQKPVIISSSLRNDQGNQYIPVQDNIRDTIYLLVLQGLKFYSSLLTSLIKNG